MKEEIENKPVRVQNMLDTDTDKMLDELAKREERSRSSELHWLIRREYYRLIEPKPDLPNL